jgi:hypothetical protein
MTTKNSKVIYDDPTKHSQLFATLTVGSLANEAST